MAAIMTKRGNQDNVITYEFICDSTADLQAIEPQYITLGSIATVISGETGFEVYMANSQKQWISLGGGSGNSGGSEQETWVNKDIIVSVPESASYDYEGETYPYQSNIQLNNHIITGTVYSDNNSGGISTARLCIKIDPSIISSFITQGETISSYTDEYYIICTRNSTSEIPYYSGLGVETLMDTKGHYEVFENSEYNMECTIYSMSDSLMIYKLPGYIIQQHQSTSTTVPPILFSYALSHIQPEATYDISQLTYQAGE